MNYINDFDDIKDAIDKLEISESSKKEALDNINKKIESQVEKKITVSGWLRVFFVIAIISFFAASYYFVFNFITEIIQIESDLMLKKIMDPKDRSINTATISALLTASVVQTGLAFYTVARYLFGKRKV